MEHQDTYNRHRWVYRIRVNRFSIFLVLFGKLLRESERMVNETNSRSIQFNSPFQSKQTITISIFLIQ